MGIKHLILGALTAFPFMFVASATAQQAAIYSSKDRFYPVYAANGMVASQEALATRIGVSILEQGGNAVDAGAAVAFPRGGFQGNRRWAVSNASIYKSIDELASLAAGPLEARGQGVPHCISFSLPREGFDDC